MIGFLQGQMLTFCEQTIKLSLSYGDNDQKKKQVAKKKQKITTKRVKINNINNEF